MGHFGYIKWQKNVATVDLNKRIRKVWNLKMVEMSYNLTIETAKQAYNWFHNAFPDFKNDPKCTTEDIRLKDELESWLISQGE